MEVAELLLILTILVSSTVKVFMPLHPIKTCAFPSKSHGPLKLSRFSERGSHANVVHGSGLEADVAEINGDWDHSLEEISKKWRRQISARQQIQNDFLSTIIIAVALALKIVCHSNVL
ncbi:hypothetical protein NC653_010347 [Populus alba x Populus x berolinensis]|uniref:Uncharacterized protein n=1 Tax=Populus alba x Populus x berolinensis TaxID=444605 RepID=A0AAD6QZL8_9ROSI|nr:hypothetical protein NC653_010347 [Populus alba x Populus x berolinensis]